MWVTTVHRRQFIDIVEGGKGLALSNVWETDLPPVAPVGDDLSLLWREKPDFEARPEFPAVVVVADKMRRDFLAWALTYFKAFRPFTAFCRVIDPLVAVAASRQPRVPALQGLEGAALGLILGEAIVYSDGRQETGWGSVIGCASTCSFTVARALGFGVVKGDDGDRRNVWRSWFDARKVTHQSPLRLTLEDLRAPWLVMLRLQEIDTKRNSSFVLTSPQLDLGSPDELADIASACVDLRSFGEVEANSWDRLTGGLPGLRGLRSFVKSSREDRVRSFELALEVLLRMPRRSTSSFLAGCIVSQIGPGTMDHARLLQEHTERLPGALLWYGLCAGLDRRANLKSVAGGLGRRILRDLLREEGFLDQPRCDIALSELEVLGESDSAFVDIRSGHPGQLEIEIAPCVSTLVRWPTRFETTTARSFVHYDDELKYLMTSLDDALGKVDLVRKKLSRFLLGSTEVQDRPGNKPGRRRDK